MKRIFRNGRYANVTATLALIVALGGTSYAAITLPRNSVGSKQIKKRAVTNSKLRPNAVTTSKVKDGSLRAKDFKTGDLPAGPAGATNVVLRYAGNPTVPAGQRGRATIPCQAGEKALNGGLAVGATTDLGIPFTEEINEPVADNSGLPVGWTVVARNTDTSAHGFLGYVVCAKP